MIVTIDGPAGSGKSTVSRQLAERLGFEVLDTGAMYRAVAFECVRQEIDLTDPDHATAVAQEIEIHFHKGRVLVNGDDATAAIRLPNVTEAASVVARNPAVRERMDQLQRNAAAGRNVVSEGRDQGTVVFPDAECKFFLTASLEARARRRMEELGDSTSLAEQIELIRERDERDETRDVAPLRPADDAIQVDTSDLLIEQVLQTLLETVQSRTSE